MPLRYDSVSIIKEAIEVLAHNTDKKIPIS